MDELSSIPSAASLLNARLPPVQLSFFSTRSLLVDLVSALFFWQQYWDLAKVFVMVAVQVVALFRQFQIRRATVST